MRGGDEAWSTLGTTWQRVEVGAEEKHATDGGCAAD